MNPNFAVGAQSAIDFLWRVVSRRPALSIAIAGLVISNFLYFVAIYYITEGINNYRYGEYILLSRNLFNVDVSDFPGNEILIYRILVPFISYVLHLPKWFGYILPYIFSVISLFVLARALLGRVDVRSAFFAVVTIALTGGYQWAHTHPGHWDAAAFVFMALAMLIRAPVLMPLFVLLGSMADERMIFALPAIIFFRTLTAPAGDRRARPGPQSIFAFPLRCMVDAPPFLVGVGLYAIYRHAVTAGWIGPGIATYYQSGDMIRGLMLDPIDGWARWVEALLWSLRWVWVIVIAAGVLLWRQRRSGALLAFCVAGGFVAYAAMGFADTIRGFGYVFPLVAAAYVILAESVAAKPLRRLLVCVLALMIVTPSHSQPITGWRSFYFPFPVIMARTLLG